MEDSFPKRLFTRPPILFPFIALFHLLILAYSIWNYSEFPFPSVYWVSPLWILCYTMSWLFICDLRRWAAFTYIALVILNVALQFFLKGQTDLALYTPPFYFVYILFSLFIFVHFKKFR
jgi:hypothetical protein